MRPNLCSHIVLGLVAIRLGFEFILNTPKLKKSVMLLIGINLNLGLGLDC